jgi:hypothetical protein
LKIPNTKRVGEVTQGIGPEFKPWYHKKKKKKKKKEKKEKKERKEKKNEDDLGK